MRLSHRGDLTVVYREDVTSADRERIHDIVASAGFFSSREIDVAVELVDERLQKGAASGYCFLFAEHTARAVAYACFGPIACTLESYDLYWIAVHSAYRGIGLGRELLARSERLIARQGGRRIYVETSARAQYEPTRGFYRRCGYRVEAILKDFYAPGDDKVIYVKPI
jgi:D-alanine-D-alanine ligase